MDTPHADQQMQGPRDPIDDELRRWRMAREAEALESIAFLKQTLEHLAAIHSDFLTDGTRKDQRVLLLISFLLLFVALGSIQISDGAIKQSGLNLAAAPENIKKLGLFVCLFFEITYVIRCYTDWTAGSARRSLSEQQLVLLQDKLPIWNAPRELESFSHRFRTGRSAGFMFEIAASNSTGGR